MAHKTTVVTFVLDETGSMQSIKDDTIGGFNSYIGSLKDEKHGKVEFSLIKFDSSKIDKVYVGESIQNVVPLTYDTYQPGAATPLVDASYKAIKATEAALAKREGDEPNVLCVVQTDGLENASTEYSFKDLTALVKEKEGLGWVFVFLGAGIDAYDMSTRMGISQDTTMSYSRDSSRQAYAAAARSTAAYRVTGKAKSAHFSDQQRTDAGDKFYPGSRTNTKRQKSVEDFSL